MVGLRPGRFSSRLRGSCLSRVVVRWATVGGRVGALLGCAWAIHPQESRKQSVFPQVFEGFSVHARALLALPDGMAFGYLCGEIRLFVIADGRFAPMEWTMVSGS